MAMPVTERLRMARHTYGEAVASARRRNTASAWRRLVRAGQNLRDVERAARRATSPGRPRPRRSVLLVEGDPADRDALRELLSERLEVWSAADGESALQLLRSMRSPPSVILLDLTLPSMSGRDLQRHLDRDRVLSRIPLVVMSACRGAGVHAARFFEKPFDPTELLGAVSQLVVDGR
jgi:CheY-like chemotaxis protein